MTGIVYAVGFEGLDKIYVGSTTSITNRRSGHLTLLRGKKHHSPQVQQAYDCLGEKSFLFVVLEEVEDSLFLRAREYQWLQRMSPDDLLNAKPNLVGQREPLPEYLIELARKRMIGNTIRRGQKMPDGYAENLAEKMRGNNFREGIPHSDDIKAQISQSLKRSYAEGRRGVKVPHAAGSAAITFAANIRKARFLELTALGRSTAEIMADIGISRDTVSHYRELRKKGLL